MMRRRWAVLLVGAVLVTHRLARAAEPTGPTTDAAADRDLSARLDDIDRRAGRIKDLSAHFEQKKFTALLKKPLVSSGRVRMRGALVRWDTEAPEPAVLHADGHEIRMYYPRRREAEVYPLDRRLTDLAASPLPRLSALRQHFSIERDPAAGDVRGTVALRLTPTDEFLKEHVDRVLVRLDVASACVASVEVDDADGDRTLIAFSEVRLNSGVAAAEVDLSLPAGTKVSRPLDAVQGESRPARDRGRFRAQEGGKR
jgi:outer membrane lipoprotein carrier protein